MKSDNNGLKKIIGENPDEITMSRWDMRSNLLADS